MRDSSFLTRPNWMEQPWAINERSSRDRLFDIAAKITVLYSSSIEHRDTDIPSIYGDAYDVGPLASKLASGRVSGLVVSLPGMS